jgi:hypothetical protein
MLAERLAVTTRDAGEYRYDFTDVKSLHIECRRVIEFKGQQRRWDGGYCDRPDTFSVYSHEELAARKAEIQEGKWRIQSTETRESISLVAGLHDGTRLPSIHIWAHNLPDLFAGKLVSYWGHHKFYHLEGGVLHILDLELGGSRHTKHSVTIPRQVLVDLFARMNQALKRSMQVVVRQDLGDRHYRFWTPSARIVFSEGAEAIYKANLHRFAYDSKTRTLATLVAELVQTARNFSASQADPVILNLCRDGGRSLYFYFVREKTQAPVAFNGGIIWHPHGDDPEVGSYSVHT